MRNGCFTRLAYMIVAIVLLACCLVSCATRRQIEYRDRDVVRYNTQYVHDTTYVEKHDSTYHSVIQKGDTVYDTKYIERTRWRDKIVLKSDTCWRDSIVTQYKEKVVVEKVVPKWCWYCLVFCIAFAIFAIIKIYRYVNVKFR